MNDAPKPQFEDVQDVIRYQLDRRRLLGGGAALALAGLLGACSDNKGGSYADKPAGTAKATMQVQVDKANIPTPREETVIVGQVEYTVFDSWNRFIPNGWPASAGQESVAMEAMFFLNLISGELIPWQATGYEYNADHTQLTLKLDPKAKWNDGQPFTSKDVKFTVELLRDRKDLLGGGEELTEFVKTVETPDDHTAVLVMKKASPRLHYGFIAAIAAASVNIVPEHVWRGKDPTRHKNNPPVHTGPYKLKQAIRAQKMFVWEKNPDYWNKDKLDPAPKYVVFQSVASQKDSAALAFEHAQFDSGSVDDAHATLLHNKGYPAIVTAQFHDPNPRVLWLNNDPARGVIAETKMHWAINHLLDREKIGTTIWPVKVPPATYLWADYPGNDKWKNDQIAAKYPFDYDPQKAAQLLDEIAPKGAGGKRTYKGKPINLEIITPSLPDGAEFGIGSFLRDQLVKVGVGATVRSLSGSVHDEKFQRGQYDISSFWAGMTFDPGELYEDWQSAKVVPIGKNAADKNKQRFTDQKLDQLYTQVSQLDPNSPQAKPLFDQLLEIYFEKLPLIPVIQTGYPQHFNTTFWSGWPSDQDPYQVPCNWWPHFIFLLGRVKATGQKAPS